MRGVVLGVVLALAAPAAMAQSHEPAHAPGHAAGHAPGHEEHDTAGEMVAAHAEEHHGQPWAAIIVNFIVFVALLAWFGGRSIKAALDARRDEIVSSLTAAERARAEAQAKLDEAEAALAELDGKVAAMVATATRNAQLERERILASAHEEAERILAQAEAQVADLGARAQRRLRETAADLSVELARDLITRDLKPEDRARVFDRYLKGLKEAG